MKLYLKNISNNTKFNVAILGIGFVGNYGLILLTNIMGLHISLFQNQLQRWNSNCSPFMILMVIGLLNIARNLQFKNVAVNYISKLSLLIYIIHENIILRTYYRPVMWQYVYTNFGYDKIILWTFALVFIVFTFGFFASILYQKMVQKFVWKVSEKLYFRFVNCYGFVEQVLMKIQ
jgi:hypothetical protein